MAEQYVNLANSTTVGSIDGVTNPITFSVQSGDGTLFPATANGNFRVTVCDTNGANAEVMMVTSRATDTFTASRGTGASLELPVPTLITHAGGSIVSHDITVGGMNQIRKDLNRFIFSGALPTDGRSGDLLFPTDDVVISGYNGTVFVPGLIGLPKRGNPNSQTWSALGAGATITARSQSILLQGTAAAGASIQGQTMAVPATPYTIIASLIPLIPDAGFAHAGICLTDGTKVSDIGLISEGSQRTHITGNHWNSVTSFNGGLSFVPPIAAGALSMITLAISDDGTNKKFGVSPDGGVFIQSVFSETHANFLTPTRVGYFVDPNSSSQVISMVLLNWFVAASALF